MRKIYACLIFISALRLAGAVASPEKVTKLRERFTALDKAENAAKHGYIAEANVRKKDAPPLVEKRFDEALQKLTIAESALARAQQAEKTAMITLAERTDDLQNAEIAVTAAKAEVELFQQMSDPDPTALAQTKARETQAILLRNLAKHSVLQQRQKVVAAEGATAFARQELNAAADTEQMMREQREQFLAFDTQLTSGERGMLVQRNTILVRFHESTPVDEIERTLNRYGLVPRSGIADLFLFFTDITPPINADTPALEAAILRRMIETVASEPSVRSATPNVLLEPAELPRVGSLEMVSDCWSWHRACPGTDGLKLAKFPQAWNFVDGIRRRGSTSIEVGVLDAGFAQHDDLPFASICSAASSDHGNHVLGTISAGWDNQKGIDGGSPFVHTVACAPSIAAAVVDEETAKAAFSSIIKGFESLLSRNPQPRVINVSLEYGWHDITRDPPEQSTIITGIVEDQGIEVRELADQYRDEVIVVAAAGNGHGLNALWASPFNWATLGGMHPKSATMPVPNVLVVESVDRQDGRSPFSNVGGTIAAMGEGTLSAYASAQDAYGFKKGTSMAAPIVSAAAALVLAYNPNLTPAEVADRLQAGRTSPPRPVSAFRAVASAVDFDKAIHDLADLNGNNVVDSADFAIFRDDLKQVESQNFTRDLNGDDDINLNDANHPRSDLNGDGILSRNHARPFPGFAQDVTDLDILKRAWQDPNIDPQTLNQRLDQ